MTDERLAQALVGIDLTVNKYHTAFEFSIELTPDGMGLKVTDRHTGEYRILRPVPNL